jgi:uncharacterized RDD family membrane protein YckC
VTVARDRPPVQVSFVDQASPVPHAAPVGARLAAATIDELALAVPLVVVLLLGLRATRATSGPADLVSTLALLCWAVAALLYGVLGGGEGQTPGKRALRIVVVDATTGRPIGYERALVRTVVLLLMVVPCCLGLLSVTSARAERHRGWHDRAAGSVVVRGSLS